jgi:arylsulfatase A-like enzyme
VNSTTTFPARRETLRAASFAVLAGIAFVAFVVFATPLRAAAPRPNIVFILADDLGYGDLGSYGQKLIQTPRLDLMAREGMRFTQFYAGSTVCAPSRSVLMTGRHVGHTTVRGNAGQKNPEAQMLRADDVTVAKLLQQSGYATALIGKWGLGEPNSAGHPNKQGFDYFFGFLSQHHAHNHFPDHLWRDDARVPLPNVVTPLGQDGAGYATERVKYAGDLFADEALQFIERNRTRPFFLYLALTVPHANNERTRALKDGQEVPDYGIYTDKDWTNPNKGQAAMITRMDRQIGELIDKLKSLGLDEKTLVLFTSDNGPHKEGGNDPQLFNAGGGLRGLKRDLYEGGIRVPFIARWPGKIPAGIVSPHVGYFGDFLATAADLAGAQAPANLDSLSLVPVLTGDTAKQARHEFLYWEFFERGFSQAVLLDGRWKGIRLQRRTAPIELYDLTTDLSEQTNLATQKPELTSRIADILKTAHAESPLWPIPKEADGGGKNAKQ